MYKDALKSILLIIVGASAAITACMPIYYNDRTKYGKMGLEQGMNRGSQMVIDEINKRVNSVKRIDISKDEIVDFGKVGSLAFIVKDGVTVVVPVE